VRSSPHIGSEEYVCGHFDVFGLTKKAVPDIEKSYTLPTVKDNRVSQRQHYLIEYMYACPTVSEDRASHKQITKQT
jgi:hypothetical protein